MPSQPSVDLASSIDAQSDQEFSSLQVDNDSDSQSKNPENRSVATIAQRITVRIEGPGPSGSGTIVGKSGQFYEILTAWHVVSGAAKGESLRILFGNGKHLDIDASNVRRIKSTDMASLKMTIPFDIGIKSLARIGSVQTGDKITVSGWSLATQDNPVLFRLLPGVIVSVASVHTEEGYTLVYTTASPTLEGMSGGPVINDAGLLVGIHGRVERLPIVKIEGVKDIASTNGQAMPMSIFVEER
jgi:S1-C subfamily serine protease